MLQGKRFLLREPICRISSVVGLKNETGEMVSNWNTIATTPGNVWQIVLRPILVAARVELILGTVLTMGTS